MNRRLAWIVYMSFSLFLAACEAPLSPFISENVCEPPCWQYIVPGETSRSETLAILESISSVESDSIVALGEWNIFNSRVFIELRSKEEIGFYFIEDEVSRIVFDGNAGITYEEVLTEYGLPEYILTVSTLSDGFLFGDAQVLIIIAIYPANGLAFTINSEDIEISTVDEICPEWDIIGLEYFDPKFFDEFLRAGIFSGEQYNILTKP